MSEEPNRNCRRCGKPFFSKLIEDGRLGIRAPIFDPILGNDPSDVYCPKCCEIVEKEHERERSQRKKEKVSCRQCNGTGKIKGYKCLNCGGKGYF